MQKLIMKEEQEDDRDDIKGSLSKNAGSYDAARQTNLSLLTCSIRAIMNVFII
jgi:hypothetical protein